ncbi:hypothetical protein [Nocardioides gilvus]|uniref:hypothetical protein n=1 Tax=Nocardioides gilvus TaxID=1735589 RepID=UPI000D740672|nr:hypothetical protein [Nocardioides gilvus]
MQGRLIRVTHGAYRPLDAVDPVRATLTAWLEVLPPGTCFTHVTAAEILGLWLPPLPPQTAVVVQLPPGAHPVRRPGLRALRSDPVGRPGTARGMPVASVPDVLLSLCRDLDDLGALMALDAALHQKYLTRQVLEDACASGRHGAPRLRRLLRRCEARTESAWETVLREFHRHVEAPVTPQYVVTRADGRFVARGDLRVGEAAVLHEYDGGVHRDIEQHRSDLLRDRRLEEAGWVRRGYTSRDLLHRPQDLLRDVDRTLGRVHEPARLAGWGQTLRTSTLTRAGRALLWPKLGP